MLALLAAAAPAAELGVTVSGRSWHLNADPTLDYNEHNTGLGVVVELDRHAFVTAGTYYNSNYRESVYALYGRKLGVHRGPWLAEAGIMVGGVTGYTDGVVPAVLPMVSLGHRRLRLNATFAPKVVEDMAAVVAVQLEFRR